MNFYALDYTIGKISEPFPGQKQNDLSREQRILKKLVGQEFPPKEAKHIFQGVLDHKWYVSEHLNRDIGLQVAAVDFFENFHEPNFDEIHRQGLDNIIYLLLILFVFLYSTIFLYLLFV